MYWKKRFLASVLAASVVIGLLQPVTALAQEIETIAMEPTVQETVTEATEKITVEITEETTGETTEETTEETVEETTEETVEETTGETTEETVEETVEETTEETVEETLETVEGTTEGLLLMMAVLEEEEKAASAVLNCRIESGKVVVTAELAAMGGSDDGVLYLFAVPNYVDSLAGQIPAASVEGAVAGEHSFQLDLNLNTENSLLYSKFYAGILQNGQYTAISCGNYITNPEKAASSRAARANTVSKKGVHINFLMGTDLEDLGIQYPYFGICLQDLISNTPTERSYEYNGKTYYFTNVVADYDLLIGHMTKAGMSVTVGLLNAYRAGYEYLIHPSAGITGAVNYAWNTSTQKSVETFTAAVHFLAERYNGGSGSKGRVENWIFGNEVNDNKMYYYMGQQDMASFVRDYQEAYRLVYNAVKSAYSNANVYICLQHRWNTPASALDYPGRDFIDEFASVTKEQGDIDWGLAYHPYSFPMNDPVILNDGEPTLDQYGVVTDGGEVKDSVDSYIITMKNLHVLTDYFHREELLNPDGQVRSILLTEQGYTSYSNIHGKNEALQAANIALGYYIAEMNPDIDAFILRTLVDEDEGSPYFKFGLRNAVTSGIPGTEKLAYEMYRYIDTPVSLNHTRSAKAVLGIGDWAEVVDGWDASVFKSMGTRKNTCLNTYESASGTKDIVTKMLGNWEVGYNVFDIGEFNYTEHRPNGVAVANPYANYLARQGVEKHFATPISVPNYLIMDLRFQARYESDASDRLEVIIRLHSGDDVLDAIGIVDVNRDYKAGVDLRSWSGRNSIDCMEVLIREHEKQSSFDGTFSVLNVRSADSLAGMTAMEGYVPPAEEEEPEPEAPQIRTTPMYRLYNPNTGEHFYTGSIAERDMLTKAGWQYEGVAWNAPVDTGEPVYRLFNPNSGDHHYTMSTEERDMLVGVGWRYEGICWNSAANDQVPQFRLYNPNADCGSHHYTGSSEERDFLVSLGWRYEGIGWFGVL